MEYKDLVERAIQMLDEDDELFINMVDELDNYMGFADGYRAYDMGELDELCYGMSATDLIEKLTKDFNIGDNWFYFSMWGLESTDDKVDLYRSHTDSGEVFDNIKENFDNGLYFNDPEFEDLMSEIVNFEN